MIVLPKVIVVFSAVYSQTISYFLPLNCLQRQYEFSIPVFHIIDVDSEVNWIESDHGKGDV